jgi:hypothetical protein
VLTPRVREAFAQMGLLRFEHMFEHMKDSIEEAAPESA